MASSILSPFLEGFTWGSPFSKSGRPNAPTQVFATADSNYPQKQLVEYLSQLEQVQAANPEVADPLPTLRGLSYLR